MNVLPGKIKKNELKITEEKQYQNFTTMTTPAHLLINKELNGVLETAIARLPEKYRMVFATKRSRGPVSERSGRSALSLNEMNIKVRLNRAKMMLRENLQGYHERKRILISSHTLRPHRA